MNDLAPIVLFVYNRPKHTLQTLEALSKNELANESTLYVYADGAKDHASVDDVEAIAEIESIVKSRPWCKEIIFVKREKNIGLAENISSGVTEVVNRYGKVIVLEDDIVTTPGFLTFLNQALDLYQDDTRVMHISGYMFPVKGNLPETFFIRQSHCWGWATWSRAWIHFTPDTKKLIGYFSDRRKIRMFDLGGAAGYYKQLTQNYKGLIKTWAVKWYAAIFMSDGLCLHPNRSFVTNVGMDGSGVHSKTTSMYDSQLNTTYDSKLEKIPIVESPEATDLLRKFYQPNARKNESISIKIKRRIRRFIFGIISFLKNINESIHRFSISVAPNIRLGATTKIKSSAIVEIRFGGSIRVGNNTELLDHVCVFSYGGDIVIGENCSINPFTIIYGHGGVTIGNNVLIAGHCMIIPNNHSYSDPAKTIIEQGNTKIGIEIGDDVWIGHGCSILDGVVIGKGSVIAAGSVVNKNVEPYTIVAGVPAKKVNSR